MPVEITIPKAAALHLLCGLTLLIAHWLARNLCSWTIATHPTEMLVLYLFIQAPIVTATHSLLRQGQPSCSYLRAASRGLLSLPAGALIMAFGAIVLGAPVGVRYLMKTIYWSLLMALFTIVPPACVFGSSKKDWCRILSRLKPEETIDGLICLPGYGSVVGAWVGAWPMPLDWERPWQEWPICVTYGAFAGYLIGSMASMVFVVIHRKGHVKKD